MKYTDLGLIKYGEALKFQTVEFEKIIAAKSNNIDIENHLIFCEHPHVFTLGKNGALKNLLVNTLELSEKKAEFFEINRGGDITYHGPGQLVGYPIFDLDKHNLGLKDYIYKLEEVIIETIRSYGIIGNRLSNATGVWLDVDTNSPRKICAIGVQCKKWVTMHGFALNVKTDLSYFELINPCGFVDKKATSIEKELNKTVNFEELKSLLKDNIYKIFN